MNQLETPCTPQQKQPLSVLLPFFYLFLLTQLPIHMIHTMDTTSDDTIQDFKSYVPERTNRSKSCKRKASELPDVFLNNCSAVTDPLVNSFIELRDKTTPLENISTFLEMQQAILTLSQDDYSNTITHLVRYIEKLQNYTYTPEHVVLIDECMCEASRLLTHITP